MSREVIFIKPFIQNYKLLRCETKVYTLRKEMEKGSTWLIFTLVGGFEAYSTALRGMLTCQ